MDIIALNEGGNLALQLPLQLLKFGITVGMDSSLIHLMLSIAIRLLLVI